MSELPGIAGSERFEQPGVFLAETRDEADWFVEMAKERHPLVDIWSVTLDGIDGEETRIDGFLCWTAPIPRSHLELVEKDL